jgi:serine/threonine protein kinase
VRKADGHKVVLRVLDGNDPLAANIDRLKHELDLRLTLHGLPAVEPLALSTLNGVPALELEDFVGEPLDRLVTAPLSVEDFLALAISVAAAVGDIHSRGIIHKDLNPGSILFDPKTRRVKVANFGAASRVVREQTAAGPERLLEESLPYVSPELTGRMNRAVDSRSDLYSLGITYYQLLTGRLPFTASDAIGWVHCHVARKPAHPARFRDALPSVLSEIVLKLLAKVPDDRYQSAAGLQRDLERCLRQWRESGTSRRSRSGRTTPPIGSWFRRPCTGAKRRAPRCGGLRARRRDRAARAGAGLGPVRHRKVSGRLRAPPADHWTARVVPVGEVRAGQTRHPLPRDHPRVP